MQPQCVNIYKEMTEIFENLSKWKFRFSSLFDPYLLKNGLFDVFEEFFYAVSVFIKENINTASMCQSLQRNDRKCRKIIKLEVKVFFLI